MITPAEIDARNLSYDEIVGMLCDMAENDHPHIVQPSLTGELIHRLTAAGRIARMLEDSLFYARMYKDQCPDGRERREKMIDEAVDLISVFRNGGIYP